MAEQTPEQRISELEKALDDIKHALWKPRQTFPEAKHEVALILQRLKERP